MHIAILAWPFFYFVQSDHDQVVHSYYAAKKYVQILAI